MLRARFREKPGMKGKSQQKGKVMRTTRGLYYKGKVELDYAPAAFDEMNMSRGLWFETELEIESAFERARDKALLLRWVRKEMRRRLNVRERRFVEQYYFQAMSMHDAARGQNTTPAAVSRSLRRAVHKLRAAAREEGGERDAAAVILSAMRRRDARKKA